MLKASGPTDNLCNGILVLLTKSHSLLDGDLVEGIHGVLDVGVHTLAVGGDSDLDGLVVENVRRVSVSSLF